MGKIKKKWLNAVMSVVLVLCMVAGQIGPVAVTYAEETNGSITASLEEGVLTINGIDNVTVESSMISNAIPGFNNSQVKEILFTGDVAGIGMSAFRGYANLEKVTIPASVMKIGASAFEDCTNLHEVILEESSEPIKCEAYAFKASFGVEGTIDWSKRPITSNKDDGSYSSDGIFQNCTMLTEATIKIADYLDDNSFKGCTGLEKVTFVPDEGLGTIYIGNPENITTTAVSPFGSCTSLEEVVVDAEVPTVVHVGVSAFSGIDSLKTIKSADDTKVTMMVETGAFYDCDSLVDILPISGGTRSVAGRMGAFQGCDSLKYVEFAEGCTTVTSDMFNSCKGLETVKLSDTIEKIEKNAFAYCTSLKDVYLSANLTTMEQECFRECKSLTEIDIPHGVKIIPKNAFCDSGLEKVTYGDVEVFDQYAFSGTMLKEFRIPASTTRVDYGAFAIDVDAGVIRGYVEATDPVACWVRDYTFGDAVYYSGDMRLYLSVPRVDDANDAFPPFSTANNGEHAWYLYKNRFRAGWAVNVNDGIENGTVTSVHMAEEGETDVPIYVMPDFGYSVKEILFTDADGNALEVATETVQRNREYMFTMPGEPVYITVVFENAPTYTIDYNDDLANGKITVTVNGEEVEEGAKIPLDAEVTLTVTADKDYVLNEFSLTDSEGNEIVMDENNTFLMPNSDLSVRAIFIQNHNCGCVKDETAVWKPFNSVATQDSYGSWDLKEPGYYVLTEDIKVEGYQALGIHGSGNIYLCLNGHTIESSGDCTVGTSSANITICDCGEEKGEIKNTNLDAECAVEFYSGNLTLDGVKITAQAGPALYVSDPASTITIKSSELKSYANSTKFNDYDNTQIYGGYAVCFASWRGKIIAEDSKFTSEKNHAIYFDVDTQTASENKFTNCRVVSKNGNALSIEDFGNDSTITIEGGIYKAINGAAICEDTNRQNVFNIIDATLMSDSYAMELYGTEVLKLSGNVIFDGAKGGIKFNDDGRQDLLQFDASEYTGKKIKLELYEGTTPTDKDTPAPVFAATENDYSKHLAYTSDNWGITHDGSRHYAVIRDIITQPTNDEMEADGFEFNITVSSPNDARYQWYKLNGAAFDENAVLIEGATGTTFTPTEKGYYLCEVTWVNENGEAYFKLYSNTCIAGTTVMLKISDIRGYAKNYKFNGSLVPVGKQFSILDGEEIDLYFELSPSHCFRDTVELSKLKVNDLFGNHHGLDIVMGEVTPSGNGYVFKCTISFIEGSDLSDVGFRFKDSLLTFYSNSPQKKNLSDVLRGEVLHSYDQVTNDLDSNVTVIAIDGKDKEEIVATLEPGNIVTIKDGGYVGNSSYFWKVWDKPNSGSYDNTYGDSENILVTLIERDSALQVNPEIKVEADDSTLKNYTVSGLNDEYAYFYSLTPIEDEIEAQKTLFNSEAEIRYEYNMDESELDNLIQLPKDGKVSVDNKYMIHVYAVKETVYGCTVYGEYMDSIGKTPLVCNITDNSEIENATVNIDKTSDIVADETVTVIVVADENYEFVAEPVINIEGAVATLKEFKGSTIVIAVDGFTMENVILDVDAETKRTPESIIAEVKPIIEALIEEYEAKNETTVEELQQLVDEAIADYVELGVATVVTITDKQNATYYETGSLTGNVEITFEDVVENVEIDKEIAMVDMPATVIVTNPKDTSVTDGEGAEFNVVADGIDITYQWMIDRNDGQGFVELDGKTSDIHTIDETFMEYNGYKYKCVITNGNGESVETEVATLTVVKRSSKQISALTRGESVEFRDSLKNDLGSDATVYITDGRGNVIVVILADGEVFDIVEEMTDGDVTIESYTWEIWDCPSSGSYDNVYEDSANKTVVLIPVDSEKQTEAEITATTEDSKLKEYVISGMKDGYDYYYSLTLVEGVADSDLNAQKTLFNSEATVRYTYYIEETALNELTKLPEDGVVTVDNKYMIRIYAVKADGEANLVSAEYMDCIGRTPLFFNIVDNSAIDNATVSIDKTSGIGEEESITVTIVADEDYEFVGEPVINLTGAKAELVENTDSLIKITVESFTADATIDVDVETKRTAESIMAEVKPIVEAVIEEYVANNDTTVEELQKLVDDALVEYVTYGVETVVTITDKQDATYYESGSLTGDVKITCEDVVENVEIDKEIAILDMPATVIVTNPKDITVTEGESAEFNVVANGIDISYQWMIDRNDGQGFVELNGKTSDIHTIDETFMEYNGYKYKCVITNGNGESVETEVATLTVVKIPVFYDIVDNSEIDNATVSIDKSTDIAEDEAITVTIVPSVNYEFATAPIINISAGAKAELIENSKTLIKIKVYDFTADATIDVDVTTKKTAEALVAEAKVIVVGLMGEYLATNSTTADEIQQLINAALDELIAAGVGTTVTITDKQDATCDESGKVEGNIEIGCESVKDNVTIDKEISNVAHIITHVAAKAATCTEDGNKEYYVCDGCGAVFADKNGETAITLEDVVVEATGHNWSDDWTVTKEPTATEEGKKEADCLNGCGEKNVVTIPALGEVEEPTTEEPTTEEPTTEEPTTEEPTTEEPTTEEPTTEEPTTEEPTTEEPTTEEPTTEEPTTEEPTTEEPTTEEPTTEEPTTEEPTTEEPTIEEPTTEEPTTEEPTTEEPTTEEPTTEEPTTEEPTTEEPTTEEPTTEEPTTEEPTTEEPTTEEPAHTHTMIHVAVKDATCTEDGNKEYYVCDECDGVFADINGETAITLQDTVVEATGHNWSDEWTVIKAATATEEGKKAADCLNDCGQKKVVTIPKFGEVDVDGSFDKFAELAPDAPLDEVTLDNSKEELLQAGNILTEEEKQQKEDGVEAKVWLEITMTDVEAIPSVDKVKIEQAATDIMGGNLNITYFDADLFKVVGDGEKTSVPEPGINIKITIVIPRTLLNNDNTVERQFKLLRLHEGKVDVIEGIFNPETSEFTFESDKFSTYAIVYDDVPVQEPTTQEPTTQEPTTEEPTTEEPTTEEPTTEEPTTEEPTTEEPTTQEPTTEKGEDIKPGNTGDSAPILLLMVIMLMSGMGVYLVSRKKNVVL